jgi:hypothetical protein
MKNRLQLAKARRKQGGYALLLVVFLTALVVVGTMSIGLRILTEGRREKEQEMIWRGKQYTRGIKLYYRKLGRFPTSMDDLVKPKIGNLRFMRQAYKDPMNKPDGTWRLIYVGPAGQLIGSLNPSVTSVQMPAAGGQPGTPGSASSTTGGIAGQPSTASGFAPGSAAPGTPASAQGSPGSTPGTGATAAGTGVQGTDTGTGTDSQAVPTGDTPTIVGGSIIGVGSKVNQRSVMVFEKAHNYRLFEFVWDPSKDMGIISSQPGAPIGTPAGAPGQNPPGPQPNNPLNPPPSPPTAVPNPNPSQP